MIRLNITMPESALARLEALAVDDQGSRNTLIEKALTLYELARNAARDGKSLAILDPNGEIETKIVGL